MMATNLVTVQRNKDSVFSLITAICSPISYLAMAIVLTIIIEAETPDSGAVLTILFVIGALLYFFLPLGLAIAAVAKGVSGLRQIKLSAEKGRGFAIAGIVIGGFVLSLYSCCIVSIFGIAVFPLLTNIQ